LLPPGEASPAHPQPFFQESDKSQGFGGEESRLRDSADRPWSSLPVWKDSLKPTGRRTLDAISFPIGGDNIKPYALLEFEVGEMDG
jgi:hypothetical protein